MSPVSPLRLTRASAFSAVCVALACLGHLTASGEPMSPWAVCVGFLAVLGVANLLTAHERSLPTIAGGLVGGQFALHTLFVTSQCHPHPVVVHGSGSRPGMSAAHLLAAVAAAWWLRRGERAVWTLARRAWIRPLVLSDGRRTAVEPVRVVSGTTAAPPAVTLLRYVHVRRGPPWVPVLT
jgi:hypothetical protein